jgi:hypothetical protein
VADSWDVPLTSNGSRPVGLNIWTP